MKKMGKAPAMKNGDGFGKPNMKGGLVQSVMSKPMEAKRMGKK